jgi:chemotaxis protein histidine kinase CheA
VVQHGSRQAGIAVDVLHGASQAVIKPLAELFKGLPGVAGSTILGTGRVALILDVPGLLRKVVALQAQKQRDQTAPGGAGNGNEVRPGGVVPRHEGDGALHGAAA